MKRLILSIVMALFLVAYTSNQWFTAEWTWVPYPGQNPPGEWVMTNLTPNL